MDTLVLDKVSRRFGGLYAVRELSLSAPAGRITGLIGPNGAGKTTVVNLITGLLRLDSGQVLFDGRDISREPPDRIARAGFARTFQNIRLMREATVLDNVLSGFHRHDRTSLPAQLLGLPAVSRQNGDFTARARTLLDLFGLRRFEHNIAGEMAYGHQRRIEMARALAVEPKVLLLDEPVAGMNDVECRDLAAIYRDLAASGIAVLLIEHNMRFVMGLCDHIHVLNSGELIAAGTPAEIQSDPRVIEAYLGAEACST